jgi:hypothetical protein
MNMDTTNREDKIDDRSDQPLAITVVGKTDVGKTAIIQTFTSDAGFGKSRQGPGITTELEAKFLQVNNRTLLEVYDSPGLHHISEVRDCMKSPHFNFKEVEEIYLKLIDNLAKEIGHEETGKKKNRLERKRKEYEQDLKVLDHIKNKTDLVFFVVNITQKPTEDDKDMALILARIGTVIPLMNYVQTQGFKDKWEDLFKDYWNSWSTFDAYKSFRPNIKALHSHITLILKNRHAKKAGDFDVWKKKFDKVHKKQIEKITSSIVNLVLDVAHSRFWKDDVLTKNILKKNPEGEWSFIPNEELDHETGELRKELKDGLANRISDLESNCHKKIIKILRFNEDKLENPGYEWKGEWNSVDNVWTNNFRRHATRWWVVYADKELLGQLLERALVVAKLFLQRGRNKDSQGKNGREQLEKKSYKLGRKLENEMMANPLLSKVHKESVKGGDAQKKKGKLRWQESDSDIAAFDKLRNLIRGELRKREESQEQ